MTKPKRGRPLKDKDPLTTQISFRLSEREAQNLLFYCWRHDLKPSEAIRDCLDILSITGL